jgi:hypothetical protein
MIFAQALQPPQRPRFAVAAEGAVATSDQSFPTGKSRPGGVAIRPPIAL